MFLLDNFRLADKLGLGSSGDTDGSLIVGEQRLMRHHVALRHEPQQIAGQVSGLLSSPQPLQRFMQYEQ